MQNVTEGYRVLRGVPGARAARVAIAQDRLAGTAVVLKTLPLSAPGAAELQEEARLLGRLRHPGLVRLFEAFNGVVDDNGVAVAGFATRWVDGEPLTEWGAGRDLSERVAVFVRALDAVIYLHRCGWLHLDLKPANLLGTGAGPVLLDLGSARPADSLAGTAGGTLGYAAPEVLRGEAPSPACDLYSLGVILYELVVGRSPFAEAEGSALRSAVLAGDVIPPRALDMSIPRPLAQVMEDLLQTQPADRPESVAALRERLCSLNIAEGRLRPTHGDPPLVGRGLIVEQLLRLLRDDSATPRMTVLVGAPGSGRSRVAREVLRLLPRQAGRRVLDLSEEAKPLDVLLRAVQEGRVGQGVGEQRSVVFVGRLEALAQDPVQACDVLDKLVKETGIHLLLASPTLVPQASPIVLPPLPPKELQSVAGVLGLPPGGVVLDLARTCEGLPGVLLDRLARPMPDPKELPAPLKAVWSLLSAIPDAMPRLVEEMLPEDVAVAFGIAIESGTHRRTSSRVLQRAPLTCPESIPDRLSEVLASVKGRSGDLAWEALLAARAGDDEHALACLERGQELAGGRGAALEASLIVGERGHLDASIFAVRALTTQDRLEEARHLLLKLPFEHPGVAALSGNFERKDPGFPEERSTTCWREHFGWHPLPAAQEAYTLSYRGRFEELGSFIDEAVQSCSAVRDQPMYRAAMASYANYRVVRYDDRAPFQALLAERTLEALGRLELFFVMGCFRHLGDFPQASRAGRLAIDAADREGMMPSAAAARLSLASLMMGWSQASEARDLYVEAGSIAAATGNRGTELRVHASLAELEIRVGRLPAAERHLTRFDEVRASMGDFREADVRGAILWASYDGARGRPRDVVNRLQHLDVEGMPHDVRMMRALYLLEALIELGAYEQAMEVSQEIPDNDDIDLVRRLNVARGRIYLAMGRYHLDLALRNLPDPPDPLERETAGRALLAAGGEDLDPASFSSRRDQLERAARLLPDELRARAVALRERLLEGPGAALEQVVGLIEAMGDGPRLLEGLARIMADALGAHRVLVMLRMPGLGRQVTAREISGQEAAGLAPEILRHLGTPDDVWRADDAFADPNLRRMSATVRTFQIRSVVAVAIPKGDQVIGALYADDLTRSGRFSNADVRILQRLARAIGRVSDRLPAEQPVDGLTVHDVHGVYLCDERRSRRMTEVLERFADQDGGNLLITGPTGAGKTWLASRLARERLGLEGTVDVVLRPGEPGMLVSQLTGTRRGDFTGAVDAAGAIQRAWSENKALFLDEVQNLGEIGQRVLLPLLELPVRRFGGLTGDARALERPLHVILGTNAEIEGGAWKRVFREDLWFRMARSRIDLPPLAERGREAVYRHLGDELERRELPAPEHVFDRGALARLSTHRWPGNFRTLTDLVDQAAWAYRRSGRPLTVNELDSLDVSTDIEVAPDEPVRSWDSLQAKALLDTLASHHWVQADAARELGMSKFALHRLLKRLDLLDHVRSQRNLIRRARA